MMKKGNGSPICCAHNLLKIFRGEVPFERMKGLPSEAIDASPARKAEIEAVAQKIVEVYEPRATQVSVKMNNNDVNGDFVLEVNIN